ncbi:hypothetical protein [Thalassolituus pacificus]|uniref:Uncharacterized protein n=1 Tax=Thalassolituus pacificus TaxID=2975440 RepID=A0A9X2WH66_9GAMM|nr:hypothetical protein [Thalassolituus pacificus]MCT7360203.1 hypothetical protein [Thalassolituus pacificus]
MNSVLRDPREEVSELHHEIVRVGNMFLKQVEKYSILELKEHDDPTYEDVAKAARLMSQLLEEIASIGVYGEERLASNAAQAALFMERMAIAISKCNQEALDVAVSELKGMALI